MFTVNSDCLHYSHLVPLPSSSALAYYSFQLISDQESVMEFIDVSRNHYNTDGIR